MKYLYIIRHAKAEASTNEINDHDRKLINKGIERAKKHGDVADKLGTLLHEVVGHASGKINEGDNLWGGPSGYTVGKTFIN